VHELFEFLRLVAAELLDGGLLLLFLNVGVLLGLGSSRESLPRKTTAQEVKDHMTNGLEVIASRLLITKMGVDRSIPCGTCEVLAIPEGNVLSI